MTGAELKERMDALDMSIGELAGILRVTPTTVRRWLTGKRAISGLAEFVIGRLQKKGETFRIVQKIRKVVSLDQLESDPLKSLQFRSVLEEAVPIKEPGRSVQTVLILTADNKEALGKEAPFNLELVKNEQEFEAYLKSYPKRSGSDNRLKKEREALGYTQEQLARRLGVSAIAVYQWEKGTRKITPLLVRAMFNLRFERAVELVVDSLAFLQDHKFVYTVYNPDLLRGGSCSPTKRRR